MKMNKLYLSLLFNWKSKGSNEVVDFKFEVCFIFISYLRSINHR